MRCAWFEFRNQDLAEEVSDPQLHSQNTIGCLEVTHHQHHHVSPVCVYLVGTELNSVWCLRVNLSRSSQSKMLNVGCPITARQACDYHTDQVSPPFPPFKNLTSLIRGTHVGGIHLPTYA